jgi:hypothetical protein
MRNTNQYNYLSLISFKIVPMWTLPPATVKVLETSWKPFCERLFSSFVAFLMKSVASKTPSFLCLFQWREQATVSWSQFRRVGGRGLFQCCHIVLRWEIHPQKRTVYWSIVVKEKPANSYVRSTRHKWVFQVSNKATCFDLFYLVVVGLNM